MSVLHINQKNFEMIKNSEKPVLLDFYADWCGPCRMVAPLIEEIAAERSDIVVAKVNVDDEQELAGRFGVFSIPTLVVMKDGKVVVVDFKFGKPRREYTYQVKEYMDLLTQMGHSQVQGYLWYVFNNEIEEIK